MNTNEELDNHLEQTNVSLRGTSKYRSGITEKRDILIDQIDSMVKDFEKDNDCTIMTGVIDENGRHLGKLILIFFKGESSLSGL